MYLDTQNRPQGEQVDAVAPAKMKLSTAIRIGAKIRPQCRGRLFREGNSCALGAAYEGIYGTPDGAGSSLGFYELGIKLQEAFPRVYENTGSLNTLGTEIHQRNDSGESRESIASWLESQGL